MTLLFDDSTSCVMCSCNINALVRDPRLASGNSDTIRRILTLMRVCKRKVGIFEYQLSL